MNTFSLLLFRRFSPWGGSFNKGLTGKVSLAQQHASIKRIKHYCIACKEAYILPIFFKQGVA